MRTLQILTLQFGLKIPSPVIASAVATVGRGLWVPKALSFEVCDQEQGETKPLSLWTKEKPPWADVAWSAPITILK